MTGSNVVPLRPGIVIRPPLVGPGSPVVRIDCAVSVVKLVRALASEGLSLRHDAQAGEFAIVASCE